MQKTLKKRSLSEILEDNLIKGAKGFNKHKKEFKNSVYNTVSKVKISGETLERVEVFGKGIGVTLLSLLLSSASFPMGIHPLGFSLIITSGKYSFFAFLGAAIASAFYASSALPYFAASFLLFILRLTFTSSKYGENRNIKILEGGLIGLFLGGSAYVFGDFLNYDLFAALALIFTTSISVYLFSGFFEGILENKKVTPAYFEIGLLSLCIFSCFALRGMQIFSFMPSLIIASVITLCAAKSGGGLYGASLGLLCGIAAGSEVNIAVMTGLGGLLSGAFYEKNKYISMLLYIFGYSGIAVYAYGFNAFGTLVPESILGVLIFIPISKYTSKTALANSKNLPSHNLCEITKTQKNLDGLSSALSSLSNVFFKISDKMRYPAETEISVVVDRAFEKACSCCSMQEMCICKASVTKEKLFDNIATALSSDGLNNSDLPTAYIENCIKISDIVKEINMKYRDKASEYFRNNKTEILASEYSAMARIIKYTSMKSKNDTEKDERLEKAAATALDKIGITYREIRAYGKRSKVLEVYGVLIDKIPCSAIELSDYLSGNCRVFFTEPEFVNLGNSFVMKLYSRKKIALEYSQAAKAKGQADVNGDSISFFENDEGFFYALISDGMGSGREAALTSKLTSLFIEKLLTTGAHKTVTLELLNNLLLAKNDESFATVDLLEVDLLNGEASFIKAGAAPAYIIRSTKLYRIASSTPPAGIIQCFTAENTRFSLEQGDVILMLSDGIIQSFDDTPWLSELIKFDTSGDISLLCGNILNKAIELNVRDDDMSVVAARVVGNN